MSASVRRSATGVICGSLRRPSRYLMSCQWVKNTGWPASDGVPGVDALPSAPWQGTHGWALRRPASASPAAGAGPGAAATTATTARPARSARGRREERGAGPGRLLPPRSALIADPVDRSGVVVGDQEGAVLHLLGVDRAAPDLVAVEPPLDEDLVLGHVALAQGDHHHAEADLLRPVPRAALGEEHAVLVLGREHRAGVEL